MPADDREVLDPVQHLHQRPRPAGREHERIAARQDHLGDFGMLADIDRRRRDLGLRHGTVAIGSDHFAAEAEATIDRADAHQLQQHPIGVTMNEPEHRAVGVIADRIGPLDWGDVEFARGGDELPGNRPVRSRGDHGTLHRRTDADGKRRLDRAQSRRICSGNEPRCDQVIDRPQCSKTHFVLRHRALASHWPQGHTAHP